MSTAMYFLVPVAGALLVQLALHLMWPATPPEQDNADKAKAKKARGAESAVDSHAAAVEREAARREELDEEAPPFFVMEEGVLPDPVDDQAPARRGRAPAAVPAVVPVLTSVVDDDRIAREARTEGEKRVHREAEPTSHPHARDFELPAGFQLAEFTSRD